MGELVQPVLDHEGEKIFDFLRRNFPWNKGQLSNALMLADRDSRQILKEEALRRANELEFTVMSVDHSREVSCLPLPKAVGIIALENLINSALWGGGPERLCDLKSALQFGTPKGELLPVRVKVVIDGIGNWAPNTY